MQEGGKIVEVEGGHVVRRKDRHSKVCTAKGPRDRRVRLSAHTAIQFYDVQDRLGYDTPSKAVDWLINKSKSAIDQLALLPPWKHTPQPPFLNLQRHDAQGSGSTFLPLDNDTIRTFFPATTSSSFVQFQTYPHDFLSRTTTQNLCLSLQSLQDPVLLHNDHVLFSATGFDDVNNNNMVAWNNNNNNNDDGGGGGGGGGFVSNDGYGHGQSQYFSQRGPLQSNNTPSICTWIHAPSFVASADHHHHLSPAAGMLYQSSPSTAAFAVPGDFSGFRVPARIHGEEEHGGVSTKPPSASSDSRR